MAEKRKIVESYVEAWLESSSSELFSCLPKVDHMINYQCKRPIIAVKVTIATLSAILRLRLLSHSFNFL